MRCLTRSMVQILIACAAMALAVWGTVALSDALLGVESKIAQLMQVGVSVVVGVAVYIVITGCMKMEEFTTVRNAVMRKLHRGKKAAE